MSEAQYKRVLIKVSGEALAADKKTGLDFDFITRVANAVKTCSDMGVEIGIVVGGGNFWRGVKDGGGKVERTRADYMGMLATTMNALALADVLQGVGVEARVQTSIDMIKIAEPYTRNKAVSHLNKGRVVILPAVRAILSSPPIRAQFLKLQRSEQRLSCWQRISTVFMMQILPR